MNVRMKRLAGAALLALLPACGNQQDQSAADLTFPVSVEKVNRAPIAQSVSATGTLRSMRAERVIAEVEGVLRMARNNGVNVAAGQKVSAGQLLAELENQEYLLTVRVESEKMAMDNARRELEKQEMLYKEGGVTEKELELARRTALDTRLNYETALLKVQKLQLRAPIDGFIANLKSHQAGTRVSAGFVLCDIMDYAAVQVDVSLPNTDLGRVQVGQPAMVSNYALPGESFRGSVVAIDPTIDEKTRTFTTTVQADNRGFQLRPGMFVRADIVVQSRPEAIVIPKAAVQIRNNKPIVFIVEGASAQQREVVLGIETREEYEILEGIAADEQLVVKGQETLRDKSKVRVVK